MSARIIGVLALQGAFEKHQDAIETLGYSNKLVRTIDDLKGLAGLILPGGESTVIGKLMERSGLDTGIINAVAAGLPVFGTCAGLILLAKEIEGSQSFRLGLLDVRVKRNGYGRHKDSFRHRLSFENNGIEGVFIRAPRILHAGPKVEVLCRIDNEAVLVKQDNILAAAFHPELSSNLDVHKYFTEKLC